VASDEQANLSSLSNEILKDVALTHKLLRLVNSASFVHAGGGTIGTVSRAVALVGLSGVRNMALSLVLLEHMRDRAHAQALTQEFLRALMAGMLAQGFSQTPRNARRPSSARCSATWGACWWASISSRRPRRCASSRPAWASRPPPGGCWAWTTRPWAARWCAAGACPRRCSR
jgi:hypothetical protein